MPDLPGWNSLDAVTRYHHWAEILGLVFLGFFAVVEIISYRYSQRKDDLITNRQEITRRDEEIARLRLQTAEAKKQATQVALELAKIQTPRTLSQEQQDKLARDLMSVPKVTISVSSPVFDTTDAKEFAKSIREMLQKAGFTLSDPPPPFTGNLSWDRPGAWIFVHDFANLPPAARAIQRAFAAIGLYLEGVPRTDVPPDALVIAVSSQPLRPEPVPDVLLHAN